MESLASLNVFSTCTPSRGKSGKKKITIDANVLQSIDKGIREEQKRNDRYRAACRKESHDVVFGGKLDW